MPTWPTPKTVTILEALNWGKEQLKNSTNDAPATNPMLDAQILLAHCLNKSTSFLFGHFEDQLNHDVIEKFQRFIERRKRNEPVSQILGQKDFYGRPFTVNPAVLTPRPETEQLVEIALGLIKPNSTIIDVGTGSGAIAVSIAAESQLPTIAIDIDPQVLSVAGHNAINHKVEHLISFLLGNLLEPFFEKNIHTPTQSNTIIIANLPYLTINQWMALNSDVRDYEPKRALVGGVDGLDFYDALLQQIKSHKKFFSAETHVIFEIDPAQHSSALNLILEHFPTSNIVIENDLSGRARVVVAKL